jgi:cytoskeletal protein CcmA (bactofilin family)
MPPFFGGRAKRRRRSTDRNETPTTCIASGLRFEGTIEGEGNYLVQGEIVGNGDISGVVTLAAGATWRGELAADLVRIAGTVEGNVTAATKIELAPTAVVTGDLSSPVIAIAEGAVYEGAISRPRRTQVTRFTERRAG